MLSFSYCLRLFFLSFSRQLTASHLCLHRPPEVALVMVTSDLVLLNLVILQFSSSLPRPSFLFLEIPPPPPYVWVPWVFFSPHDLSSLPVPGASDPGVIQHLHQPGCQSQILESPSTPLLSFLVSNPSVNPVALPTK